MIRHGESEDNIQKIYSRDNTRLTKKGIDQIKTTKELLKHFNYDKVYYSPLTRTVETLNHLGLRGIEEPQIREFDFGDFVGRTFQELLELYPEEAKKWIDNPYKYTVPNGENIFDVYYRVVKFIEELSKEEENVLLVCHDCVIRLALCWIFDNPEYFFNFKVDNGSINIITIDEGFKYIKMVNHKL